MAILKQRLNRKNSSGSYDTVYLENIATNIKMSDTDSTLLSDKISSMDTTIAGKQPAGSYAAANHNHNGVYQPVGSYAAANHSHNGANLSFDDTRSINDVINSNYNFINSVNNEVSSLKSSVSSGKTQIASAITDKGVSTAASATFSQMANNIRSIETVSGSLINLPNGYLYSTSTFVHGFSMGWFDDSYVTSSYPVNSNYVNTKYKTCTNLINWESGRGSNTRVDRYYDMYNNGNGNYFSGINLKGYTQINVKMTERQNGNVYMFIVQLLPSGVLQLYRYTISANYSGTVSLGFTGNSRPYTIICGAFNGYYHTIQFT